VERRRAADFPWLAAEDSQWLEQLLAQGARGRGASNVQESEAFSATDQARFRSLLQQTRQQLRTTGDEAQAQATAMMVHVLRIAAEDEFDGWAGRTVAKLAYRGLMAYWLEQEPDGLGG
jgi:hypothetical protein